MADMLYRKLDANDDYTFGQGTQEFLTDADAVAQAIKTSLLLFQGEWWEDTSQGLPMFQSILGQSGTPEHLNSIDLLIQSRILAVTNVSKIINFTRTYVNRAYQFSCTVVTSFGTVSVEIPLTLSL